MTTASPETITVTIVSSAGEEAALLVNDAMRQILDVFSLLSAAGGEDGSLISWQLIDISMKSPLRVTAAAVQRVPGVEVAPIARREKLRLADSLDDIVRSARVPDWIAGEALTRTKSLFERNTNGIGRTEIQFNEDAPTSTISHIEALRAVRIVEAAESSRAAESVEQPWIEYGTIEGTVRDTTTKYGNPVIIIRDSTSGEEITCFASEIAISDGSKHTWAETWANKRVLVTGQITYRGNGTVSKITSADFELVDSSPMKFEDISDPNFTNGLTPSEYIRSIWSNDGG